MSEPIRIGMIGLDTSHVVRFAEMLNHADHAHHVPGAQVALGCPESSEDYEPSASRVEQFTASLRDEHGVKIVDTPESVAEQADLVFITSVDGRKHRSLLERTVEAGKPTFIDKPLCLDTGEAERIFETAAAHEVPVMSTSALRYAGPLMAALEDENDESIRALDVHGPMDHDPVQRGWFWYGIHQVEVAIATLGTGVAEVVAVGGEDQDVGVLRWDDGRMACLHGWRTPGPMFGAVLHRESDSQTLDLSGGDRPYYAGLLEAILNALPAGRSDIPVEQTLEVIRTIERLNRSMTENPKV